MSRYNNRRPWTLRKSFWIQDVEDINDRTTE